MSGGGLGADIAQAGPPDRLRTQFFRNLNFLYIYGPTWVSGLLQSSGPVRELRIPSSQSRALTRLDLGGSSPAAAGPELELPAWLAGHPPSFNIASVLEVGWGLVGTHLFFDFIGFREVRLPWV